MQRRPPRRVPPTRLSCATSRHPRATVKHSCREGIGHKQNDLAVLDFNSTLHWSLRPSNTSACSIVSSRLNRTNKSVIRQCYTKYLRQYVSGIFWQLVLTDRSEQTDPSDGLGPSQISGCACTRLSSDRNTSSY